MSSNEHTLSSLLSDLLFSLDGAVLGAITAAASINSFLTYKSTSSAVRKIREAPSVKVSDLRSLIPDISQPSEAAKLVVLRGCVQAKPGADAIFKSLKSSAIVNPETNEKTFIDAVIVERTQRLIYDEWRSLFGLTYDLKGRLLKMFSPSESSTIKSVPFVLGETWSSDFVVLNLSGSSHPLPLVTVYQQKQLFNLNPYTFLHRVLFHDHPIGLLDEEKVLPVGVEVSAVGVCNLQNGALEIKSCNDLPCFMSLLDKDELVLYLESKSNARFWVGVSFGLLSVGILCYTAVRNWQKLKEWRQQMLQSQEQQESNAAETIAALQFETEDEEDEEDGDVFDGQLCIICLTRRRRSAFIPCGHLVCCHLCCISVERSTSPKCPVCRQEIRTAIRIYDS